MPAESPPTVPLTERAPGKWRSDGVGRFLNLAAKSSRGFLDALLTEAGASFGVWSVLAVLDMAGPLIQRDLAERLSIEGPTLTRHLAHMESRGLVTRQRSETDRRAALVALTPKGRSTYQRLTLVATDCYEQVLRGFTVEEIELLRGMLMRIHQNAITAAESR
jgi:MarR family transcriptional regulator for hemolysin